MLSTRMYRSGMAVCLLVVMAGPVMAERPRIHIFGPEGCAYFDGLGGDGAAFHALDDAHLILDHEVLQGTQVFCRFDVAFSLIGATGRVEEHKGYCEEPDGSVRNAIFTLTYSDPDHASLVVSTFEDPIPFTACNWP